MRVPTLTLGQLTFEEAKERVGAGAVAFLPCGSTEAHGPHLPLATDVVIAEHAAERAARKLYVDGTATVVLPPLAYAVTDFAKGFSGTISVSFDTARGLVRDVVLGAVHTGFRAVVLCNAHLEPEHLRSLREGADAARAAGASVAFPDITKKPHALRLGAEFRSGACHAGAYETSLVLAANPFLVRSEIARGLAANPQSLSEAIRGGVGTFEDAGGPRAYFGAPAEGNEADGDALFEVLADVFAEAARELLASGGA